ncbi:hypothetical protein QR680_003791 [Steinernema hermaphroditum]|uniref:Uncharacterized protein n=1 Tax=Steinernema hermaphroditum TaxID=289476 RepID=A0AA39HML2_9BILA|nr:hypothetical protein QR680_003791 [Steinernema hermaphroditum]
MQFKLLGGSLSWERFLEKPDGDYVAYEVETVYFMYEKSHGNALYYEFTKEKMKTILDVLKESTSVHVEFNCAFPKHGALIRSVLESIGRLETIRYSEYKGWRLTSDFLDFLLRTSWLPNFTTLSLNIRSDGNLSFQEVCSHIADRCLGSGQSERYALEVPVWIKNFLESLLEERNLKKIGSDERWETWEGLNADRQPLCFYTAKPCGHFLLFH